MAPKAKDAMKGGRNGGNFVGKGKMDPADDVNQMTAEAFDAALAADSSPIAPNISAVPIQSMIVACPSSSERMCHGTRRQAEGHCWHHGRRRHRRRTGDGLLLLLGIAIY